ncbi:hypothetical protein EAH89_29110 [Roseomonas nepalensis]|uniref:Transglycosylase SLT domain-containing protein n=1 Tax=Muricoccus nepalensis TaxID=1854500 RepID=A0A502ENZ5_9PROT|nr:hypothetical protein [Roseomonas nepalensis]TPG39478.1 hypothetical protein EAH89_29110 [Roseomonas nepalensis]
MPPCLTHHRPPPWAFLLAALPIGAAHAQVPLRQDGPPEQVIPYVLERGLENFVITPGPAIPAPQQPDRSEAPAQQPTEGEAALALMLGQSWGALASQNAEALGVSPAALAATCAIESGCRPLGLSAGGRIGGAYQMLDTTYASSMAEALRANPNLAVHAVPGAAGNLDPATQSIAASQYLRTAALSMQRAGIDNPTVLDTRGYYNFGPRYGAQLALSDDGELMTDVLRGASSSVLTGNRIGSDLTVGAWRSRVTREVGSAAGVPVLLGS